MMSKFNIFSNHVLINGTIAPSNLNYTNIFQIFRPFPKNVTLFMGNYISDYPCKLKPRFVLVNFILVGLLAVP